MTETEILNRLTEIFRDTFRDDSLVATPAMTAKEVERWDSLSHVDMIVAVEDAFSIRIPTWQVGKLANVGELVQAIQKRLEAN